MKITKALLAAFVAALALLSGCEEPVVEEVKVSLDKSTLTISKAETKQLTASVSPATSKVQLEWTSSNNNVVKVSDEGHVTGLAAGEAVVTVTADQATASCKVTVRPTAVEKVELDKTEATMLIGEKLSLKAPPNW